MGAMKAAVLDTSLHIYFYKNYVVPSDERLWSRGIEPRFDRKVYIVLY